MRRRLLTLISLLASLAVAGTVYKWVDENGVVHYSDQPHPEAQKVDVPPVQTYKGGASLPAMPPTGPTAPPASSEPASAYQGCAISEPANDQTFTNVDALSVVVRTDPGLGPGDRVYLTRYGRRMAPEGIAPSALAHFDPADLLDALTTGIVMLDAQLCPMYANVAAQDLLAFSLKKARGHPFADFLHDANGLSRILKRALETGEGIADRELAVRPVGAPRELRTLDVTITPLTGLTGTYLLLELADTTQRQRITRENDLLARLDGIRLMVQQLAHEIKNPLGGLRGAAQLLER